MRILFFILATCTCCGVHSQVNKLNAETSIQNVTIFSSGAQIERSSSANIQAGRTEISFRGLSNQLDQQTVQLKADANITLLSVQTTKDFLSQRKIDQEEKDFIDRINILKDKLELDKKLSEVYKNEEGMLVKNQAIGGQTGVKTTELKEALEFQRDKLTEVYNKELEIQKRLASEQLDVDRNNAQLQEISKKRDSINYIVTALVESKETQTVNFQLLYNVSDAGWYPSYDVRVTEITQPLKILMNANVFQRSGESWKNIPLQLSTGSPKDNATPSNLQPWMLGYYDPSVSGYGQLLRGEVSGRITDDKGEPVFGATVAIAGSQQATVADGNGYFKLNNLSKNSILKITEVGYQNKMVTATNGYMSISLVRSSKSLNDVVVVGYANPVAGVEVDDNDQLKKKDVTGSIQRVNVQTVYQPTTSIYRIEDKYDLESDGKTTTIGIKQIDVPATYDYYTTPKVDPIVFLNARISNWQDLELQSGEASLYYEGTYLGKTYIDLSTSNDTLSLALGKDNGVKISRKLLKEYSSKKFIGSNRTDSRQYEIIVRNTKQVPVVVTLVDQIPVSTNKDIVVEDVKTTDAQLDKDSGISTWILTLQPGQERKLEISYSVKYPKDRKVVLD